MTAIAMSASATALLRALLDRASVARNRILLTEVRSVDWQSLTFVGERHQIGLRIPGPGAAMIAERLCDGLQDTEFNLPGIVVADIGVVSQPLTEPDGTTVLTIEALTIEE